MLQTSDSKPAAICLMGPTASGKTDLAIALCERYPCDIISVDSALIYRGMDIGTAKPSAAELARAPHRLIDIRDPSESYSAAEFRREALAEMRGIAAAGRIPLLVGGTMLYFKALLQGLAEMPEADAAIRAEIEALAGQYGWPHVHGLLAEVDAESAARIHPNHSQRIERALEVFRVSGVPLSEWHRRQQQQSLDFHILQMAIAPARREVLHARIKQRFQVMMEQGFVDEVTALRQRGDLHPDLPAMRAVGYRQVWQYLEGECNLETAVERGITATRQLAKRQFTWLRGWPGLHWIRTDERGLVVVPEGQNTDLAAFEGGKPLLLAQKTIDDFYSGV